MYLITITLISLRKKKTRQIFSWTSFCCIDGYLTLIDFIRRMKARKPVGSMNCPLNLRYFSSFLAYIWLPKIIKNYLSKFINNLLGHFIHEASLLAHTVRNIFVTKLINTVSKRWNIATTEGSQFGQTQKKSTIEWRVIGDWNREMWDLSRFLGQEKSLGATGVAQGSEILVAKSNR